MTRTMSYASASKTSHKLATKYSSPTIDTETFTITNGAWKNLTRVELLELPWIVEALQAPTSLLVISDCFGIQITEITEGGSIRSGDDVFYIAKNILKSSWLSLHEMWRDEEGYVRPDPLNKLYITSATVTTDFTSFAGKPNVCCDGPVKYRYYADGTLKPFY